VDPARDEDPPLFQEGGLLMKVNVEGVNACRKVLHVQVPSEDTKAEYEQVVQAYAGSARIPGFRKGKAPPAVVERKFSKAIAEEARERLVPRYYREALDKEGIVPVAIVSVQDVEFAKDAGLDFKVTVDIAPAFKLPRYKKISLKRQKVEVTEEDVDKALTRIREQFSRFEDVEGRELRDGDLARIDYSGLHGGQPVGDLAPDCSGLGEGKDFWVLMGEPEFLPGFSAALKGAAAGETRDIDVQFPDDYHVGAVAGKAARYTVTVKGMRERILPEFDEALLKQLQAGSEAALRERVRNELVDAAEANEKHRLQDEIAKHLLKKTTFDLPQSVVDHETNTAAQDIVRRMAMGGHTREQIQARRDEIVGAATQASTDRVKLSYILGRIAEAEKITVTDEDREARLKDLAERSGTSVERVKADLDKADAHERLRRDIRAEKTLQFLLEHAKIKG
jgi:trigger factor